MEKDFSCNSSSPTFSNIEKDVAQTVKKARTVTTRGMRRPSFNRRGSILEGKTEHIRGDPSTKPLAKPF